MEELKRDSDLGKTVVGEAFYNSIGDEVDVKDVFGGVVYVSCPRHIAIM